MSSRPSFIRRASCRLALLLVLLGAGPLVISQSSIAEPNACSTLAVTQYFQSHKNLIVADGPSGGLKTSTKASEGSQKGTWAKDSDGTYWFMKPDAGSAELQTAAEVISSSIYRYLGYTATEVSLVNFAGKRHAAVKSLGNKIEKTALQKDVDDKYFRQLRGIASYLKDWDRLREGPNNADLGNGKYALFDFGGTLGSRAGGSPKPGETFSDAIGAFEANATYQDIIGSYRVNWLPNEHPWKQPFSKSDLRDLGRKFAYLTDAAIDLIVSQAKYSRSADAAYMKQALKSRRDAMIEGINQELGASPQQHALGKPVQNYNKPNVNPFTWTNSQAMSDWQSLPVLSDEGVGVLKNYISGKLWTFLPAYFSGLNEYTSIYGNLTPISAEQRFEAATAKRMFDQLMQGSKDLPVGLKMFRGKGTIRPIEPLQAGEGQSEIVYLPTSIHESVGRKFVQYGINKYKQSPNLKLILTEFQVMGAGVKGLFMPAVLKKSNATDQLAAQEDEILLDRGLYFRGMGVRTENFQNRTLYIETVGVYNQ